MASYDERLSGIAAGLSDAESILSDICRSISDYMDEMEFSGEDFKKTEERLDLVRGIMAKYGNSEEAVLKSLEEKKKRLEELENYEELAFAAKAEFEDRSGFWDFSADGSRRREKKQQRFWRTGSRRSLRT